MDIDRRRELGFGELEEKCNRSSEENGELAAHCPHGCRRGREEVMFGCHEWINISIMNLETSTKKTVPIEGVDFLLYYLCCCDSSERI